MPPILMDDVFEAFAADLPGVLYQSIVHPDGRHTLQYVSAQCTEVFGLSPDLDTFVDRFLAGVPESERATLLASIVQAAQRGQNWRHEGRFRVGGPEGTHREIWWRGTASPRRRADGAVVFNGFLQDVTEERQAAQKLIDSEQKYRLLFENMTSGFALHEVLFDTAGQPIDYRYLEINPAFERLTGMRKEDLLGKTIREVLPNTEDYWLHTFGKVAQHGTPLSYENFSRELGRWYETYVFSPQPGRFAVIFNDATERKRVERALQDRESLLSSLTDNFPGVLLKLDIVAGQTPRLLYASPNSARRLGLDSPLSDASLPPLFARIDEPARLRILQTTRPETLAALMQESDGAAHLAEPFQFDLPNGEVRWFQGFAKVAVEHESLVAYIQAIDITDEKTAERLSVEAEVAREANEAKTQFLARMSHELRTPLNALLGYAQLLQINNASPLSAEQARQVRIIQKSGEMLLALITDILHLSHIEQGTLALRLESMDLWAELQEVIDQIQPQASKAGVTVTLHRTAQPMQAMADRTRIREVFLNLLTNAIKYNKPGGTVLITEDSSLQSDSDVGLLIADTGMGMSPRQLAQLFQPFNRLGRENTDIEGTGIGLTIVDKLLRLMHGRIDIESLENRGTTCRIQLPHAEAASQPAASRPASLTPTATGADTPAIHVLYAEDNFFNRQLMQEWLPLRCHVALRTVSSGQEALQALEEQQPDLLLLGKHLGDMTAFELAAAIDQTERWRRIPRVLLTAGAMPLTPQERQTHGFLTSLAKPVDMNALVHLMAGLFPSVLGSGSGAGNKMGQSRSDSLY
jgi:PAS domain S-box-containing protein